MSRRNDLRSHPRLMHITTVPMSLVFLRGQSEFMRQAGLSVLAVSAPGTELLAFGVAEGVTVHSVPMERRITPLRDVLSLFRLVVLMRRERPDIVHAHTPKGGLLGMLAAGVARVPCRIYHMHGLPMETARGRQRALLRLTERVSCAAAHRVICVSTSLRTAALRERLAPARKLRIPARGSANGVDAMGAFEPSRHTGHRLTVRQRYGIPADAIVVLFLGRLVRDKGIQELVAAWKLVRESNPKAHLLIVGPIESRDPVSSGTLADIQADDRICLAGPCWDVPPLYAAADLVVLPSYREGFPNVPLEAAAMSLPVVVSDATGCADAIEHGVTGLCTPVGDVGALAAALQRYLSDPELRRRHGVAGRKRVLSDFQQEAVWDALLRIYRTLLRWQPKPADASPRQ